MTVASLEYPLQKRLSLYLGYIAYQRDSLSQTRLHLTYLLCLLSTISKKSCQLTVEYLSLCESYPY